MNLSEDQIRELAIQAVKELGDKATPEAVQNYIENELAKSGKVQFNKNNTSGRVILTSFGLNATGIVSSITKTLSDCNCDILDISQKIMQEFFTMIMMIDISNSEKDLKDIQEEMNRIAESLKVKIYLQHEDVFRFMHRI
ncbi:MAG: ACT domain-containing protein [Ignavibacteria bacterium]|nr:ACT domain-containing protein [Ignavibacteria bacterium]MDP3831257.1 ACT domain-containing protein [Ignavibacteriaceae bacterium]